MWCVVWFYLVILVFCASVSFQKLFLFHGLHKSDSVHCQSVLPWNQWVEILHFHCAISKKECQNNQLTPNCIILTVKREAFTSPSQVSHGTDAISKTFPESCDGSLDFFFLIEYQKKKRHFKQLFNSLVTGKHSEAKMTFVQLLCSPHNKLSPMTVLCNPQLPAGTT